MRKKEEVGKTNNEKGDGDEKELKEKTKTGTRRQHREHRQTKEQKGESEYLRSVGGQRPKR